MLRADRPNGHNVMWRTITRRRLAKSASKRPKPGGWRSALPTSGTLTSFAHWRMPWKRMRKPLSGRQGPRVTFRAQHHRLLPKSKSKPSNRRPPSRTRMIHRPDCRGPVIRKVTDCGATYSRRHPIQAAGAWRHGKERPRLLDHLGSDHHLWRAQGRTRGPDRTMMWQSPCPSLTIRHSSSAH
jgi:hypothetical protein